MDDKIKLIAEKIKQRGNNIAFTGAGISTESGIPDYRRQGGIWDKFRPVYFDEFMSSHEAREEYWKRWKTLYQDLIKAEPNPAHIALMELHRLGLLEAVITQNVDGLHQASGLPDEMIIELHGNSTYAKCLSCETRHEIDWVREEFTPKEVPPPCIKCGGIVKSATISFGQAMPVDEMGRAERATLDADLFIVIGSSLVVYPAAGFPLLAKENGARLAIINRDPTPQDDIVDIVIHAPIGPTLSAIEAASQS